MQLEVEFAGELNQTAEPPLVTGGGKKLNRFSGDRNGSFSL